MSNLPITVERGAALLDELVPGWDARIDTERLDLSACPDCVVGQVFGDYIEGLDALGLAPGEDRRFGFMTWGRQTYSDLTSWWRYLLHLRRAA